MITWLVHRFAIGAEWKNSRKRRRRKDTTEHLKYIQEMFKCTSYNLSETSIQVFLKFYFIAKRNSCVHLCKCLAVWCGAEENNRDGFLLCCFMVNWIPRRRLKHFVGQVQVYDWSYNLTETSIQCKYLHLKLIENRNSCAHLQLFCCVVPREENEHCRSSTDFIDELLQLKSLQMRRNKKAGILKSLLEKFLPDRFRKPRTARICKPSWVFLR